MNKHVFMNGLLAKIVCVLFVAVLVGFGCSSSSDDPVPVDNSRFYGTYDVTMQIGTCDEETTTVTLGNDQNRQDEEGYLYVPASSNTVTFTANGTDIKVTVSGNTVTMEETNGTYSQDIELTFSADYSTVTLNGTVMSDDPEDCTGTISGTATKVPQLFELNVGQTGTYKVTDLNDSSNSWTHTAYVEKAEIVNSTTTDYTVVLTNQYGGDEVRIATVRFTETEVYMLEGGTPRLWFKAGDVGYEYVRDPTGDNDNVEITAHGDITLPYGTLSVYEYSISEMGAESPYLIQSISPGKFLVKEINYDDKTVMELVSISD